MNLIQELEKEYQKNKLPEIRSGDTVRIHQKIKEKDKVRIQVLEGLVIKRRGGKGLSGSFTVRKIAVGGIGVERTFLLHSPAVSKIQVVKKGKVRKAQLYYIRRKQLKSLKLKERKEYQGIKEWEEEKKNKESDNLDEQVEKPKEDKEKKIEEKEEQKTQTSKKQKSEAKEK
jgi:large subunit ribosomal protein L19